MKNTILKTAFTGLILASTLINAQTYSGKDHPVETKTFDVSNFTGVSTSTAINVEVKIGNEEKAIVTSNAMQFVDLKVKGNTLSLTYKDHKGSLNNVDTKVVVYTKKADHFSADSAGKIKIDDVITADDVKFNADSAGSISGKINTKNVKASADSAGKITLSGSAENAKLHADSAAKVDGSKLDISKSLSVSADSMGEIVYHVPDKNAISFKADRDRLTGGKITSK